MKEQLLRTARTGGVFSLARRVTRKHLRILAYHGLWTTPGYQYGNHVFMTPEQFEQRMTWLKNSGYPVIPLDTAVQQLGDGSLPDCSIVITIDDGWSSTYTHMLPILETLGLPATLYITTWYSENQLPCINKAVDYILERAGQSPSRVPALIRDIERMHPLSERERALRGLAAQFDVTTTEWWESRQFHLMSVAEIRDAYRRGLDIQLHTHRHTVDALDREIADNRDSLARACGRPESSFDHFCYPSGNYNHQSIPILRRAGVKSATLVNTGLNAPGTNPYLLRRFVDGRSISQQMFEAYLSGGLELYAKMRSKVISAQD
jgi:peptidoglycan/xylan/chitin deacetylase (PgdA/CDA1 family)